MSIALLRHILGVAAQFRMPQLSPSTPLVDVVASLEAERASHEDVEQWAIDGSLWGGCRALIHQVTTRARVSTATHG
jgi:hypothetical protein